MKKIILAAVLFLPFLVSCSQNRKAPAVSPQTTVGKSEKTETAKVQYLTTSDFRKKIDVYKRQPCECLYGLYPIPYDGSDSAQDDEGE